MYNATIAKCSSYLAGCEPENILLKDNQNLWLSHEGMPQYIVLDLTNAAALHPNKKIVSCGWYCWHSYTTNPKKIQFSISKDNINFTVIGNATGSLNSGLCHFLFNERIHLKDTPYLKIAILEVFGGEQVYVNRFYLFGEGEVAVSSKITHFSQVSNSMSSSITASSDEQSAITTNVRDNQVLPNTEMNQENIDLLYDDERVMVVPDIVHSNRDLSRNVFEGNKDRVDNEDDQEFLSPSKYSSSTSDYLDKETLDWLYDPIVKNDATGITSNKLDTNGYNNINSNVIGRNGADNRNSNVMESSSAAQFDKSLVLSYLPTTESNVRVESLNREEHTQRLGVVVHRSGNVEVKVTSPPDGDLASKQDKIFLRTPSTEPTLAHYHTKIPCREVVDKHKPNEINVYHKKNTNSKTATEYLLSDYNSNRLKSQLDDMQADIERLAFGKSVNGSKTFNTNMQVSRNQQEENLEPIEKAKKISKHPSVAIDKNESARSDTTILSLVSMLEEYNKHVAYLESRLTGAESHIVELENTIDTISRSNTNSNNSNVKTPVPKRKYVDPTSTRLNDQAFRRNVLKVLNLWERDLVNSVLDPHISAIVTKLKHELFSKVNSDLSHIRNEVKRIHEIVDDSLICRQRQQEYMLAQQQGLKTKKITQFYTIDATSHIDHFENGGKDCSISKIEKRLDASRKVIENINDENIKKKYRQLINSLTLKLEEKQRTIEAIKIVRLKAKQRAKKKKQYKATVHGIISNDDYSGSSTKIFEIGVEEK
eukprot:g3778.t1